MTIVQIHLLLLMCYILGNVPHQPVNTTEAVEHSQMANGTIQTAINTDFEGH
jgi:hypothetical protein